MAVKVQVGLPAYNKSPLPAKEPPQALFPLKLNLHADRTVWVSLPQPDKLHLSGDLLPEHFKNVHLEVGSYAPSLMDALAAGQAGPVQHTKFYGQLYKSVQVGFGSAEEPVYFTVSKSSGTSPAAHRLQVQLNPRALSQEGVYELLARLHVATANTFKVGAFLAGCVISRLDVAVDVVGLSVPEILIGAGPAGKLSHYLGADGVLETVSLFKKPKGGKKLGQLLVQAYDKRRERLQQGHEPPFNPAEVTRVEVSKSNFGPQKFQLQSLPTMVNPLAQIALGTVHQASPDGSTTWLRYVEARRGSGPARAAKVLHLSPQQAALYAACFSHPPPDVIDGKHIWQFWKTGLAATGTNYLIEAAAQMSAGVPHPADE
jgi:hypothetical protein